MDLKTKAVVDDAPEIWRMDEMKKIIACMILAMVMGISGCLSFAPVDPGENRPWDGLHDPYQNRGIR
jgi:hypothetical protein